MADLKPTDNSVQWKYVEESTEFGFVSVERRPDGTLYWISPSNPSPELIAKVEKKAAAAGNGDFHAATKSATQEKLEAADTEQPENEDESEHMLHMHDPDEDWLMESRIYPYLAPEYQEMRLSDIPDDVIQKAWDDYTADIEKQGKSIWKTGVGSLDINDRRAQKLMNIANIYEGNGPHFSQFQTFFTCLDRYGNNILLTNVENTGVTFITRPRLCFQSTNLRSQRRMTVLDTSNPNTVAFAIRALLDTNLNLNGRYSDQLRDCPLVDTQNPFFTPLCNALQSLTGLPDISIASDKMDGGYMTENQQFAIGGDDLSRADYQLTLSFRDVQGSLISSIFYFWLEYIRCVTRGLMLAYPDDIDEQCLNYTVSIYHFNLDPTGNYITDWVKCTGCYPTSMPIGAKLQVNEGEFMNRAADKVDVNFVCNKVEYRDYAIFMDFDTLMRRYCPTINQTFDSSEFQPGPVEDPKNPKNNTVITTASRYKNPNRHLINPTLPRAAWANFRGLPWITSDVHGPKLEYRRVSNPVFPRNDWLGMYDEDIADQMGKVEIRNRIKNEQETAGYAKATYPEYYEAAEKYKIKDLIEFVREAFRQDVDPYTSQRISGTEASTPPQQATAGTTTNQ